MATKTSKHRTPPVVGAASLSGEGDKVGDRTTDEMEARFTAIERNESINSPCGSSQQRTREGERLDQGQGRAARRQDDRNRQKPTIVREVRLSRDGTGAALLLADGSVWWVDDLNIGVWQPVTILEPSTTSPAPRPRDTRTDCNGRLREGMRQASSSAAGRAEAADGVTVEGLLSRRDVSAIAVVRLRRVEADSDSVGLDSTDVCAGEASGGRGTKPRPKHVRRGSDGVAIVVGRDDGCLFLLTRTRPTMAPSPDNCCSDEAASERISVRENDRTTPSYPWCVSASWQGPEVRVTAMWIVGEAAKSTPSLGEPPEGGSCHFTSALETSMLCHPSGGCHGARLDGALVSAGANSTVAWWEWASTASIRGVAGGGNDNGAERGENTGIRAPKLRMVSRILGYKYMNPPASPSGKISTYRSNL